MYARNSGFCPILLGLGWGRRVGAGLGRVWPVLAVGGVSVAADLPADGRRRTAELPRDLPDRRLIPHPVSDVGPLVFPQVARRVRRGHHRSLDRRCPLLLCLVRCPAVAPPLPGPGVDPDDPACFTAAETLIHKAEVFLPLTGQLLPPLRRPDLADLEVHRTPQAGVLRRPLEGRLMLITGPSRSIYFANSVPKMRRVGASYSAVSAPALTAGPAAGPGRRCTWPRTRTRR